MISDEEHKLGWRGDTNAAGPLPEKLDKTVIDLGFTMTCPTEPVDILAAVWKMWIFWEICMEFGGTGKEHHAETSDASDINWSENDRHWEP